MTQALIDNLPLIAAAPDGIKALRGLILDLAVRGKLVPQDPEDEPASELLKRIAGEKARLVRGGQIKADKSPFRIKNADKPFEVPPSWEWASLGQLSPEFQNGVSSRGDPDGQPVTVLRLADVNGSRINGSDSRELNIDRASISKYSLCSGDVLIVRVNGSADIVGKFVLVDDPGEAIYCDHFIRLRVSSNIVHPLYLEAASASQFMRRRIQDLFITTAGQKTVNQSHISSLPIPLPPLAEQRRIVAKVDELMALCDRLEAQQADAEAVHAALVKTLLDTLTQSQDADDFAANWQRLGQHFPSIFTTEASVDALKQAVLQMAVRGMLVRQDRNDQPVENLLARANVSMPVEEAFEVPSSWRWVCCGAVAEARLGKMLDRNKNRGTPQLYLRNLNVRWFDFDLSDLLKMKIEDSELSEFELTSGDVLVCEGGEPGRAAVWGQNGSGIYFQKALHRVRFCDLVNPHYFVKALRASADDGRLSKYFTGAGIQHFTGKSLEKYAFPLPPLAEQHRIVAKVDELFALCDSLKAQIAESRAVQRQLATALVEQAVAA